MIDVKYGICITDEVRAAVDNCALTVTDSRVAELYPQLAKNAFVIPSGENSKSPEVLFSIIAAMCARGLNRSDCIAALGGGVVGDVTGLAAALYMRGIEWINIPTTLLAMVDSGMGGKTAIDFGGVKNSVGAFHMPKSTIISYDFLNTLPQRELGGGVGEIIKTCLLTSDAYLALTKNIDGLAECKSESLYPLIEECIKIKHAVVIADPTDRGLRKILNVGHTVGHALEAADGYKLTHGEYVIKGMMTECTMCREMMDGKFYGELIAILKRFSSSPRTTSKSVVDHAMHDKKNMGDTITVMLPIAPGDIREIRIAKSDFVARYDRAIKELKSV